MLPVTPYGFTQETSGTLALVRRWIRLIPFGDYAELALAFTAQTYTINQGTEAAPVLLGSLTHRKNPFVVKMGMDLRDAQLQVDARLPIAMASLLMIIDAVKNN